MAVARGGAPLRRQLRASRAVAPRRSAGRRAGAPLVVRAATFDGLATSLQKGWKKLGGAGDLNKENIKEPLKDIRRALLEADVSLPVVRRFVKQVEEKALGVEVVKGVTPEQQLVKVVAEQLLVLMGKEVAPLECADKPGETGVILMAGLQGVGKTTAAGKLAMYLRDKLERRPLLVATDVYRPAAIEQLQSLGERIGVPVFEQGRDVPPADIAAAGMAYAGDNEYDVVIVDTAGRLQIDQDMMAEMQAIKGATGAQETLLVVDAMTGQEAAALTAAFDEAVGITGSVLTKLDGDSRGGAALSVREVSGKPIKFVGTGERMDALEPFYPERMTSRILGMGDVVTLVEKAQAQVKAEERERIARRMKELKFDFEDFLGQMEMMAKAGEMSSLMKLMPGMAEISDKQMAEAEKNLTQARAMIQSMTKKERQFPELLADSTTRRARVAKGAGTSESDVGDLLQLFGMMRARMGVMSRMAEAGAAEAGMMPAMDDEELMQKAMIAVKKRVSSGKVRRRKHLVRYPKDGEVLEPVDATQALGDRHSGKDDIVVKGTERAGAKSR